MKAIDILNKYNACETAKNWVKNQTIEEAWDNCPRGDWMLWVYTKLYPNNIRELTLAKGHCANTVRHLMKDQRSIDAVDAAIAFGEGKITATELTKYADAAYAAAAKAAAYAAYAAYSAAAYAAAYAATAAATAAAAAYAAYAAADADAAAYAAYAAADAACADAAAYADAAYADAAAYAADAAARKKNQQQTADICRQYLKLSIELKD